MSTIFQVRTAASADDIVVNWSGAVWQRDLAGSCDVGRSTASYQKMGCGMRFLNVTVPKGATIVAAYIAFTARVDNAGATVNSRVCGNKQASGILPATFGDLADYQARRGTDVGGADNTKRTVAETDWDNIGAWVTNTVYNSPDISAVVTEIIGLAGWASGQAMAFFWDDHVGRGTNVNGVTRTAHSWNTSAVKAPLLHIEYTLASSCYNVGATAAMMGR